MLVAVESIYNGQESRESSILTEKREQPADPQDSVEAQQAQHLVPAAAGAGDQHEQIQRQQGQQVQRERAAQVAGSDLLLVRDERALLEEGRGVRLVGCD